MKHYNRTLLDLRFKHELSKVGTVATCYAAPYHGTNAYAQEAVAKHRAISQSIREDIQDLIRTLDRQDAEVEREHQKVKALRPEDLE